MQVHEIMTANPSCCSPDASLQEAAKLMDECDCGEIPVVDEQRRPIGVITDRDICCRAVAKGMDPAQTRVREVMSEPVVTVTPEDSVEECCQRMEENQIRRVPVVDDSGACCGIVAQADVARHVDEHETAEVVRDVSRPTQTASRAGH
jgi:CBS domain-containing protein